jgi:hypothetical protein
MLAVLAAVSYVGCKQGDGDRCQVNEDCESGVCNKAKGTCASSGSATTEIDAPTVPDGPPADAAPDAP